MTSSSDFYYTLAAWNDGTYTVTVRHIVMIKRGNRFEIEYTVSCDIVPISKEKFFRLVSRLKICNFSEYDSGFVGNVRRTVDYWK